MSTAEQVIDRVRDIVSGPGPRPIVDTLRVGRQAYVLLSHAAGWRSAHGQPMTALFGVPIDPDGEGRNWSLRNRDGDVIAEGGITGS
jgi:hypothetical protein